MSKTMKKALVEVCSDFLLFLKENDLVQPGLEAEELAYQYFCYVKQIEAQQRRQRGHQR